MCRINRREQPERRHSALLCRVQSDPRHGSRTRRPRRIHRDVVSSQTHPVRSMIPLLRIRYFHSHRAREKPSGTPKLRASPTRSLPTRRMQACPTPSPGPVASVSKGDKQKRVTDHTMFQPRKMFGLGVPRGWAELEVRLETAGSKNKNRFFEQFPHASRVVHACSACHGKQGLGLLGVAFFFFRFLRSRAERW